MGYLLRPPMNDAHIVQPENAHHMLQEGDLLGGSLEQGHARIRKHDLDRQTGETRPGAHIQADLVWRQLERHCVRYFSAAVLTPGKGQQAAQ